MAGAGTKDRSGAQLAVSELGLTDQIIVWSLRRYRAARCGIEPLASTYRQFFGLTGVETALAAFAEFMAALETQSPPTAEAATPDGPWLSTAERRVLDLLAGVDAGDDRKAAAAATALAPLEERRSLVEAARRYAACLDAAGRRFTATAPRRSPPQRRQPSLERTIDMSDDERLVLGGIRLWVAEAKAGRDGANALGDLLSAHGAGNARPSFVALLHNLAVAATRPIDVRCPACPSVSPDEARMIHGIACGQRQLGEEVFATLSSWLAPAAARITAVPVLSLANALAASQVNLSLRDWDFARLEQLSVPSSLRTPDGALLH